MKQGCLSLQDKIVIYKSKDNQIQLEVKLDLDKDTLWLSQAQIARLFKTDRSVITRHICNIFKSGELDRKSNVHFLHIALSDKPVKFYNLDVVISTGYRVNSARATQFRIWATRVLKEHILSGYTFVKKKGSNLKTPK